jgi:nitrogen fixation/metabolism regulation signal transduction histidine kinase
VKSHDRRILLLALAAGAPGIAAVGILLWLGNYSPSVRLAVGVAVVAGWVVVAAMVRDRLVRPLQTISSLLAALREGDFSIRGRLEVDTDAFRVVMREINSLSDTLRTQRLGAHEATALLHTVMAEIDVAIFAFDSRGRLVLSNRYGERVLGQPFEALSGQQAADLGLEPRAPRESHVHDIEFPGATGRWEIRRRRFWQGGEPHDLVVLSDVSQPLREEEREAWRRLIRVIGHELNNSLAPIKSIAGSLAALLARNPPPEDWRDDMRRGLHVIESRAGALNRFTAVYATLARLPLPRREPIGLPALMRRVVAMETRLAVELSEGPNITISADPDQIEQLLINLLRNAADAALETEGRVRAGWACADAMVEIHVDDEGPGLPDGGNLFVPFFTTKSAGSGIGLVLGRQIAEAHGGTLTLQSRDGDQGTRATVRIPL